MEHQDEALSLSNPRLLNAAYFCLLAVIATLTLDMLLYLLGIEQILPVFKSVLLAVIIASIFGALFGEQIIYAKKPYHKTVFLWAFLMVIVAVPFYTFGFLFLLRQEHHTLFAALSLKYFFQLYFFVLAYSYILIGFWLAILAGLAAIYLRAYLVYYILHALYKDRTHPHKKGNGHSGMHEH